MTQTTLAEAARDAETRLADAGVDSARLDARLLVAHVLGIPPHRVVTHGEAPVDDDALGRLQDLVGRRAAREPMSQILGRREFWSLPFRVTRDTLTPRPDSETVVEAALAHVERRRGARVLDIGTGTGCLLLALLSELPAATGVGTDVSAAALVVARGNADALGFADRATFVETTWAAGVDGPFDLVVSNPPYIPADEIATLDPEVARYEPRGALDGGADGLDAYRALAKALPSLLAAGGVVVFEIGADQAEDVREIVAAAGLSFVEQRRDLAGRPRALVFTAPSAR